MADETLQARTRAHAGANGAAVHSVRRVPSPGPGPGHGAANANAPEPAPAATVGPLATARRPATWQALAGAAVAAIALGGLSACSFDTAPGVPPRDVAAVRPATDAGVHLVDDGAGGGDVAPAGDVGPYVAQIEHGGHTYVVLDGGVYELQRDDAGTPALVAVDAGAELEPDAGNASSSPDAGGELEPDAGAGPPGRRICGQCFDGTFKCPSSTSGTGFACRSWPPCYCTDAGAP